MKRLRQIGRYEERRKMKRERGGEIDLKKLIW